MSQTALMDLAKEAIADFDALIRIQSLSDEQLSRRGLSSEEVAAVRGGYLERLALAGSFDESGFRPNGCCWG
jgi:hypothetical protein